MINKKCKGMSTVLATVIIIGITVAAGALVWGIVNNLIGKNLEKSESCFGVLDQVKLNNDYTCYDSTSDKVQFSINVGDIDIDEILVSVTFEGNSQSATLTNSLQDIPNIENYPEGIGGQVKIPGKNSGSTYFFDGITSNPQSVSIIPIVNGNQCGAADTIHNLDKCEVLVD